MPYDPDPRKPITRDFHLTCLFAYFEQPQLLTDAEADTLLSITTAYARHCRVPRSVYHKAKDIIRQLYDLS